MAEPILQVTNLSKQYTVQSGLFRKKRALQAVNDVSFAVEPGKTFGIIGESGCGKTTLAKMILGIEQPTSGAIDFNGQDLVGLKNERPLSLRRSIQLVYQNPFTSLNPRKKIEAILSEPLIIHQVSSAQERADLVLQTLQRVGLGEDALHKYPHMFSGGQRQRIAIARAIILNPALLVLDEPVSALDLSVQAQVLNLLKNLQDQLGLTYLFISHDISVVRYFADETMVMYFGQVMEKGKTSKVLDQPKNPYTQALVDATPSRVRKRRGLGQILLGDIPSPLNPPSGCPFQTRCPVKEKQCDETAPTLQSKQGREVFCHLVH